MTGASGLRVSWVICRREWIRMLRQPARIIAAVGTPLLLWLFLGSGVGESFQPPGPERSYASFLLPGMMTLVAVFSAVFSSISIIEDRNEGWLQSVLVSPAPRWSIALGKSLGGAGIAFAQSVVLLPLAFVAGRDFAAGGIVLVILGLALTCLAMTALGVCFAWRSETTAGFHAVMNLVFLPMWLLSGAFFPAEGAVFWLRIIMLANPLTWCTRSIRDPLIAGGDVSFALFITAVFALAMLALATMIVSLPRVRSTEVAV